MPNPFLPPFFRNRAAYLDGLSGLERVERLERYIDRELIPDWEEAITTVLDSGAQIQEPIVLEILEDEDSTVRVLTDSLYADKSVEAAVNNVYTKAAADAKYEPIDSAYTKAEADGRYEPIDSAYTKAEADGRYEPINTMYTKAEADARYEPIDSAYTKAEADALLNAKLTTSAGTALIAATTPAVKNGGAYADAKFNTLRAGMKTGSLDTRVVILGSSNANAGASGSTLVTKREKACMERLARRAGNTGYMTTLDSLSANVSAAGMKWWNGAEGNTTSANYFDATRRTKLNYVDPHYVIHMIGENDFYYGTTLSAYTANVDSACDHIETANPNAINVLVHAPGRFDTAGSAGTWDQYGTALEAAAALNPTKRFYIDASQYFTPLGVMNTDRAGMVPDGVHLKDNGHRFLADIIGTYMGIPSETDYMRGDEVIEFVIPATATHSTAGEALSEIWFVKTDFPREVLVTGTVWADFSNAGGYISTGVQDTSPTTTIDSYTHKVIQLTVAESIPLFDSIYIPPGVSGRIVIGLWPATGTIDVQGSPLTKAKATFRAV